MSAKLSEMDPYIFLKSNIEYTDVNTVALTQTADEDGTDSYGSEVSLRQILS